MTPFSSGKLVVSLPAAELAPLDLPGSVMTADQALVLPVSHTLSCALALIEGHCRALGIKTIYLARPEIFTHGISAVWLRKHLGDVTEHLCVSDASAVKHIPGCRTHMFLYRLAFHDSYASFERLCRRVPELMAQVGSQINSRFAWGTGAQRHQPRAIYLHSPKPPVPQKPIVFPFQYAPYLAEETAHRIMQAEPALNTAKETIYLPLTETALADAAFRREAARHVRAAFLGRHALLLRLPTEKPGDTNVARIAHVLQALAASGVTLPRSTPSNIFLLSGDLQPENAPENLRLILHEGFDFWRYGKAFYEAALSVAVPANIATQPEPEFLPLDVTQIYGPRATRVWLKPPAKSNP
jgi:hypothetical protein